MEKIKINDMQTKGVVFIVKYTAGDGMGTRQGEATMNTNFNAKEMADRENYLGIGGTVDVEITIKEKVKGNPSAGFWTNITKVDMKSAVKGQNLDRVYEAKQGERSTDGTQLTPMKEEYNTDERIAAAVIIKGAVGVTRCSIM